MAILEFRINDTAFIFRDIRNSGPVWFDQNWNWLQNPLRLFGPYFLKPNPDSWNHETSPGAGFIRFKMTDGAGQVSVETPDNLFKQFTVNNLTIKVKETKQWHFDKIRMDKIDNFRYLDKKLHPDFAFFKKPDSDLTFCLFTTLWFQDPDFKIQIWFWSNQKWPKSEISAIPE